MPKPKLNKSREQRIHDEIIVDCYDETERAMGWYYYLEDRCCRRLAILVGEGI